jgi:hypothetical protein
MRRLIGLVFAVAGFVVGPAHLATQNRSLAGDMQ